LDLVWFYKAVESIILNWDTPEDHVRTELIAVEKTLEDPLLPKLDPENQTALLRFAFALQGVPRITRVDESFCRWLFAETLLAPCLLSKALDGSLSERIHEQERADFDTWAATWS
jgi:hypothetical protein